MVVSVSVIWLEETVDTILKLRFVPIPLLKYFPIMVMMPDDLAVSPTVPLTLLDVNPEVGKLELVNPVVERLVMENLDRSTTLLLSSIIFPLKSMLLSAASVSLLTSTLKVMLLVLSLQVK